MPDYSKSKIYKIICSETQRVYIGSTVQPLTKRLSQHKKKNNNCMSKILIEPKIYLVESFCCDSKEELLARERYHIEKTECVNLIVPGRTKKEYGEDNKEKILQKKKDYYKENKDKRAQYNKEYYEKNKEKLIQQIKEYQEDNQEKYNEKRKLKYTCECGSTLSKLEIRRHERTKKHQAFISQSK